jgi:hypothetical protein
MQRPELPAYRPFTRAYAERLGWTRRALQGRRFQIVFTGVYAAATLELTPRLVAEAALLATPPTCAASHHSGLLLHGVDVGDDLTPHLSTASAEPIRVRGVTVHRLASVRTHVVDGWRVLTPELCLVTAATLLDLLQLVTAINAMYHLRHTDPDRLAQVLEQHHGAGVRAAREALALAAERVESPRETYVRLMLELAGLPPLECNASYGDEHGVIARLDLSWRRWKIAVEYDGRQHGLSLAQRERDIRRRELMEREGWVFIVVTAAQLARPREIVLRVCDALRARQGWAPTPVFDDRWRVLFE